MENYLTKNIYLLGKSNIFQGCFFVLAGFFIFGVEFVYVFGTENQYQQRKMKFKVLDFLFSILAAVVAFLQTIIQSADPINIIITILTSIDLILCSIQIVRNYCYSHVSSPKEKKFSTNFKALNLGFVIGFLIILIDLKQLQHLFQDDNQFGFNDYYLIANDFMAFFFIIIFFYLRQNNRINLIVLKINPQNYKFSKSMIVFLYGVYIILACGMTCTLIIVLISLWFYYEKVYKKLIENNKLPIQQTTI